MATLSVEIVTPEKRILSVQAEEVIAPGGKGLFGVRPGHTPFLSLMEPGPLTLREGTGKQVFFVGGGFIEVANDRVLVLADHAEAIADIDLEAARKRLEAAKSALAGMSPEDARFEIESATVRRETARMHVAGGR